MKDGLHVNDGLDGANALAISNDGSYLYITSSTDHSLSWFARDASSGSLSFRGILKDSINGVEGLRSASGVIISPDGNHAYVLSPVSSSKG